MPYPDVESAKAALIKYNSLSGWASRFVFGGLILEYLALLWSERKEISRAKLILVLACGLAIAGGVYGEYEFGSQTADAALSLENLSETRIAELNKEAAGARREAEEFHARATEAETKLEAHQSQLAEVLAGRRISPVEHAKWVSVLTPYGRPQGEPENALTVTILADEESSALAEDILNVLRAANWFTLINSRPMMIPPAYNVTGSVDDRTPAGRALLAFLKSVPTSEVNGMEESPSIRAH